MNWLAATIMVIWASATIGTVMTGNTQCVSDAACVTVAMGFGYLIFKG